MNRKIYISCFFIKEVFTKKNWETMSCHRNKQCHVQRNKHRSLHFFGKLRSPINNILIAIPFNWTSVNRFCYKASANYPVFHVRHKNADWSVQWIYIEFKLWNNLTTCPVGVHNWTVDYIFSGELVYTAAMFFSFIQKHTCSMVLLNILSLHKR